MGPREVSLTAMATKTNGIVRKIVAIMASVRSKSRLCQGMGLVVWWFGGAVCLSDRQVNCKAVLRWFHCGYLCWISPLSLGAI